MTEKEWQKETDPWEPWVALLWRMLDEIIVEEDGPEVKKLADEAVSWGQSGRRGDDPGKFSALDDASRDSVIRVLVERMRLQNLAEDLGRVQLVRRSRGDASLLRGSVDVLKRKLRESLTEPGTEQVLEGRVVLTVHPTESTRRTVLQHIRRLSRLLRQYPEARGQALELLESRLKENLRALWRTAPQRANRPQVQDELELGLYYVRESLFKTLPQVQEAVNGALAGASSPVRLEWAVDSWIGGDRDGHPFVDVSVTETALKRHREVALALYEAPLEELEHILSGESRYVGDPDRLWQWLEDQSLEFSGIYEEVKTRYPDEPFRQMVALIRAKWQATRDGQAGSYPNSQAFLHDIELLGNLWDDARDHWPIELRRLSTDISIFGFHLATLDLRQHSRVHEEALAEIWGAGYHDLSEKDKCQVLQPLLQKARPWLPMTSVTKDLKATLTTAARYRRWYGSRVCERYLVSMAHAASDLLEVMVLMQVADPELDLEVVPVVETLHDLEHVVDVLNDLWEIPYFRQYVARQEYRQEIMLGYSDSTKDAGVWTASWAIYQAQRQMVQWGEAHGVKIGFFHGRGGALGRGGGSTSLAILGQPSGTVKGRFRITQQGEVLSQKFLLPEVAVRSLELMMTAHVTRALYPAVEPSAEQEGVFNEVSRRAVEVYRQLIDAPDFWEYFLAVTPIREMAALNWGSRPSWREQFQFEDLRAIPWVFSWTQNRMGVPAWYGAGTALTDLVGAWGMPALRDLSRQWPYFSTFLHNLALAVVKADLHAAYEYQSLAPKALSQRFWPTIADEHQRLSSILKDIFEEEDVLATQPRIRRAVVWRNPQVDALNHIQVGLLQQYRESQDTRWLPLLAETMEGIALGVRNSG